MSKAFRIVRYSCRVNADNGNALARCALARCAVVGEDFERLQCGCYRDVVEEFCSREFESLTGVRLPMDKPTYFSLVCVDDDPRPGLLRRFFNWLFEKGGPRGEG